MGKKSLQQYVGFDKELLQLLLDVNAHFMEKSKTSALESGKTDCQQSEKASFLAGLAFVIANYLAFDENHIGQRAALFFNKDMMRQAEKDLVQQKSKAFFHQPFDSEAYQDSWRIKKGFFYLGYLFKTWFFATKTKKLFNRSVKLVKKIADNIELNIKENNNGNKSAITVGNIMVLDESDNDQQQTDNGEFIKDEQFKSPEFWNSKIIFWQTKVDQDRKQLTSNIHSASSGVSVISEDDPKDRDNELSLNNSQ